MLGTFSTDDNAEAICTAISFALWELYDESASAQKRDLWLDNTPC